MIDSLGTVIGHMGGLFVLPFVGLGLLVLAFPLVVLVLLGVTLGLRTKVRRLEARLEALERAAGVGTARPSTEREPTPPAAPPVPEPGSPPLLGPEAMPVAASTETRERVPMAASSESPLPVDAPVAGAGGAPGLPSPTLEAFPLRDAAGPGVGQLEERVGGTWLNRVGALLVVLGVGFFLKYAFDNDWIGPAGRVATGLLVGVAFLLAGERLLRAAYRVPAQGLAAAGIAILYLAVYAAHAFYELLSAPSAVALLVLVTATGMAVAVRHGASAIALLASVGGFLTPVLLRTGTDTGGVLFAYLAVLDVGILATAVWQSWSGFSLLTFTATQLLYWQWLDRWLGPQRRGLALIAASGFFFLFALVGLLEGAAPHRRPAPRRGGFGSALLILAAPTVYFLAARRILAGGDSSRLGLLCLLLAVGYFVAGQWALRTEDGQRKLGSLHLALALGFLTLAFAVRLADHPLVIAWSVEGLALLWSGHRFESAKLRVGALGVLVLAWARWLSVLHDAGQPGLFLLAHPALPATLVVAVTAGLAALVYRARARREPGVTGWEAAVGPMLVLVAFGSLAGLLSVELGQFRTLAIPPPYVPVVTMVVWMVTALPWLALARGDRTRILLAAVTVLLVVLGAVTLDEASRWERLGPFLRPAVVNPRFLATLLLVVLYWLYGRVVPGFPHVSERARARLGAAAGAAAALLLLWNLSTEVLLAPLPGFVGREGSKVRSAGLSVLWALYAFAAMGIGMWRRRAALRLGAIALFGLTVAKVLVVDLAGLDAIYRILSFLVLGVVLLAVSFLYARYRRRPAEEAT